MKISFPNYFESLYSTMKLAAWATRIETAKICGEQPQVRRLISLQHIINSNRYQSAQKSLHNRRCKKVRELESANQEYFGFFVIVWRNSEIQEFVC